MKTFVSGDFCNSNVHCVHWSVCWPGHTSILEFWHAPQFFLLEKYPKKKEKKKVFFYLSLPQFTLSKGIEAKEDKKNFVFLFFLGYFWSKKNWGACQNSKIDVCPGQHTGEVMQEVYALALGCTLLRTTSQLFFVILHISFSVLP